MFKSWGLKAKLMGACIAVALLTLVVGLTGIRTLREVSDLYLAALNGSAANIIILKDMRGSANETLVATTRGGLPDLSPAEVSAANQALNQAIEKYQGLDKAYNDIPFVEGEGALYDQVKARWDELLPQLRKSAELSGQQRSRFVLTEIPRLSAELFKRLDALIDFNEANRKQAAQAAVEADSRGRNMTWSFVLVGFVAALGAGILFTTSLVKAIRAVVTALSRASDEVAKTSEQIAAASEQLSQASSEQASSLQETSSSLEELTSMVGKNTDNAKSSADGAQRSLANAERGKDTIQAMVGAIQDLESSNQQIAQIVKVFGEIQEKTKVIEDIVFQTQLLSFNASVEAARAGEHGKGFAVVAEEVGNLADMSGNASTEIASLLQNSLKQVESTVNEISAKINRLVEQGGVGLTALGQIVSEAQSLSQKVNEIAVASQEQSRGIAEINRAMGQLDQTTQQNAATSEEAASAAGQLATQAQSLKTTVGELEQIVQGAQA